ncbi:phytanoyl-CoA dioxygenase family protein [Flavobacterium aquicola]|uniref:Ectoine hydroxylase n=1 Tax=Flavobacterium aquicola TaxID=1682742 RepID=A0A3E0ED58_9FLAO|nr:phytanoyl-CoA dioxygenase family protein [Flavobacterium aquicola]REG96181.1 ectoine hydroxylase [Flavobacterium aquicola]
MDENQIESYNRNGYIVIEDMFTLEEVNVYKNEVSYFESKKKLPNVICEDNKIRSVFAPHMHSQIYANLYKDFRLLNIVQNLVKENLYLYQYKLNLKEPFLGKWWEWHQDYPYWHFDDGVSTPDMISAMIYLDDAKSYQGPLMVIPGSQKEGIAKFKDKGNLDKNDILNSLSSNLKFTVDDTIVKTYADQNGIQVLELRAGSVVFFHPNLFHASTGNLSPYERDTVIITYNSINNLPVSENSRPDYICSKDNSVLTEIEKIVL